ncbi:MAG: Rid family hydrolase [Chitinispirillaceae bacterium]|nr:Rid family hydrolase [Chitinispirillaceae bacterium]
MKNLTVRTLNDRTQYSGFASDKGCEEFFLALRTEPGIDFDRALASLENDYAGFLKQAGLSDASAVFSRLFVSDFVNQRERFDLSPIVKRLKAGAVSIIEEKPVGGGLLSLFSYHIRNPGYPSGTLRSTHVSGEYSNAATYAGKNYSLLLTANYSDNTTFDAYQQTDAIFKNINATIEKNALRLFDNTIRTWIYVRDVDNHYMNMVRARREYFTDQGLTDKTRYLASTGIEGGGNTPDRLVSVDSLSIGGLKPGQIVRMEAASNMSPTIMYGVTFERGLRVRFGDRSHLYVSGTASIDTKGDVMFPGDVARQTQRTVDNLSALLAEQQAGLSDMAYLIVYVRNFHEWDQVRGVLHEALGDSVPLISVEAKVCRPAWLFELEGVAVIPDNTDFLPFM